MKRVDVYAVLSGQILRFALALFFLIGGSINLVGPVAVLTEYHSWGYPPWFHSLTGALEVTTACLLIPRSTRLYATALGSCIMIGASATLAIHQHAVHAVLPVFILVLLAGSSRATLRTRSR